MLTADRVDCFVVRGPRHKGGLLPPLLSGVGGHSVFLMLDARELLLLLLLLFTCLSIPLSTSRRCIVIQVASLSPPTLAGAICLWCCRALTGHWKRNPKRSQSVAVVEQKDPTRGKCQRVPPKYSLEARAPSRNYSTSPSMSTYAYHQSTSRVDALFLFLPILSSPCDRTMAARSVACPLLPCPCRSPRPIPHLPSPLSVPTKLFITNTTPYCAVP